MKELNLEGRIDTILDSLFDHYADASGYGDLPSSIVQWKWYGVPMNVNGYQEQRVVRLAHQLIKVANSIEVLSSPSEYVREYWKHLNR